MNRRQLVFLVLVNALVSLAIALAVVWIAESRRPDLEELAALYTPPPPRIPLATATLPPVDPVATPLATATPAPVVDPDPGESSVYVVQPGDNLLAIALRFNLTLDELMEANGLTDPDFVFVGQQLVIPGGANVSQGGSSQGSSASSPVAAPQIRIAQVENPGNLDGEAVLLVNDGDAAVNLQGWTLAREGGPAYTFGDLPLFPGGSVRLHSTGGADTSVDLYWGQPQALWTPGTTARLLDAGGQEVARYVVP